MSDEMPAYTAAQLEGGIANAMKARNFEAVRDFLLVLTTVDPARAQLVLDTINVGIAIGRENRAAELTEEKTS